MICAWFICKMNADAHDCLPSNKYNSDFEHKSIIQCCEIRNECACCDGRQYEPIFSHFPIQLTILCFFFYSNLKRKFVMIKRQFALNSLGSGTCVDTFCIRNSFELNSIFSFDMKIIPNEMTDSCSLAIRKFKSGKFKCIQIYQLNIYHMYACLCILVHVQVFVCVNILVLNAISSTNNDPIQSNRKWLHSS